MTEEPVVIEVQVMPTVFDLLAEVEPVFEQSEERPTESEPEQLVVALSAFEMTSPLTEMVKEDNQPVSPHEAVEPVTLIAAALVDEPVSNE